MKGRVGEIRLTLPNSIKALNFVLKSGDNWYKSDGGSDFHIGLSGAREAAASASATGPLAGFTDVGRLSLKYAGIFEFEGRGGLALMERFEEVLGLLVLLVQKYKY